MLVTLKFHVYAPKPHFNTNWVELLLYPLVAQHGLCKLMHN